MSQSRYIFQETLESFCDTEGDLVCTSDIRPGRCILHILSGYINDSAVFIAVMSKNYCNEKRHTLEIEHALLEEKPIILIFIEKMEEDEMPPVILNVFKYYARAKFVAEGGIQLDWAHVCKSIIKLVD